MNFSSHSNFFSDDSDGGVDKVNGSDSNDNLQTVIQNIVEEAANNVPEHDEVLSNNSSSEETKVEIAQEPVDKEDDSSPPQTRLPLRKRKHSYTNVSGDFDDDDGFIEQEAIEENIKRTRAEEDHQIEPEPLPEVAIKGETLEIVSPKKSVGKLNDRNSEANNCGDVSSDMDKNQLAVALPVTNNAGRDGKKKMEMIFNKFKRSNNEVHLRYDHLKGTHGLDDRPDSELENTGVSRNVTMNGLPHFNFSADSTPSPKETESASATASLQVATLASTSRPFDLKLPDYDNIDDFENYYHANFRQESSSPKSKEKSDLNKNLLTLKPQEINAATNSLKVVHEQECGGSSISSSAKGKEGSRKMSCQDKNLFTPQLVNTTTNLLKRKLPELELRVTLCKVDLESLANYKKMEKRKYKKRKRRDVNITTTTAPKNLDTTTTTSIPITWKHDDSQTIFQVTYDKSWLSETDIVREKQAWRTNSNNQLKFEEFDEVTVDQIFDIDDYLYTPPNCDNFCCSFLSNILDNYLCLVPGRARPSPVPFNTDNLKNTVQEVTNNALELSDVPSNSSSEEIAQELNGKKEGSSPPQTRLPLKKRKHSFANALGDFDDDDDDFIGPEVIEEIIKFARAEENEKKDISYPAKPMISIAEIQEKLVDPIQPRIFKTPAQRKEMPPTAAAAPLLFLQQPLLPNIVTEQYNNPTINYHMNNVPYPFFPCTSLTYSPPILLPINSTTTFDMNMVNSQQQQQQLPLVQEQEILVVPKQQRTFKTAAQRKEMTPQLMPQQQPNIVTEQYNNATINYHMNNVIYPHFPYLPQDSFAYKQHDDF